MFERKHKWVDAVSATVILLVAFGFNLLLQTQSQTVTMTPMVFVLGCRPGENKYIINELGMGYRIQDVENEIFTGNFSNVWYNEVKLVV